MSWHFSFSAGRLAVLVAIGVGALLGLGLAAYNGALPRTRPILPGEVMVD